MPVIRESLPVIPQSRVWRRPAATVANANQGEEDKGEDKGGEKSADGDGETIPTGPVSATDEFNIRTPAHQPTRDS